VAQELQIENPAEYVNNALKEIEHLIRDGVLYQARTKALHSAVALSRADRPDLALTLFDKAFELMRPASNGKPDIVYLWEVKGVLLSLIGRASQRAESLNLLEASSDAFKMACDLTTRKHKIPGFPLGRKPIQCKLYSRLAGSYRLRAQRSPGVTATESTVDAIETSTFSFSEDDKDIGIQTSEQDSLALDLDLSDDSSPLAHEVGQVSTDRQTLMEQALAASKKAIEVGENFRQQPVDRPGKTKSRARIEADLYLVRAYIGKAMAIAQQVRLGLIGKLTGAQDALPTLLIAVDRFAEMLWPPGFDRSLHVGLSGYGKLRRFYVHRALESGPGGPRFKALWNEAPKLAYLLLWQLGWCHWNLGEYGLAGWLFSWADEYLPDGQMDLQLQVERGTLEQDINILFALDRLELLIASVALSPEADGYVRAKRMSLVHAIWVVSNLLQSMGAKSEMRLYTARGIALLRDDKTDEAQTLRYKLKGLLYSPDVIDVGAPSQAKPVTSESLANLCEQLEITRKQENAYKVATYLWRLSDQVAEMRATDIAPEVCARLEQTVTTLNKWRPKNRTCHIEGEPPQSWLDDPLSAATYCARMAWEFAENFRPGSLHRVIRSVARIEERKIGAEAIPERVVALWEDAARGAARLWHWRHATWWCLRVARWHLQNGNRSAAITWAGEASKKLAVGLDRLRFGRDKADVVRLNYPNAVEIAQTLTSAHAETSQVFEAIERCKGNVTIAARYRVRKGALTPEGRRLESALWRLFGLEFRLSQEAEYIKQEIKQSGELTAPELRERLEEIQRLVGECDEQRNKFWLDLAVESPESLQRLRNVFSLRKLEETLALQATGPTAIIEYLCDDRDSILAAAIKTDKDSQVSYYLPTMRTVAKKADVTRIGQALAGSFRATMSRDSHTAPSHPTPAQEYQMNTLYKALVEPFADFLHGVTTLYIVPHDELASLPFSALMTSEGRYLIQLYDLAETSSLNLWLNLLNVPIFSGSGFLGLGWEEQIRAPQELSSVRGALTQVLDEHRLTLPADGERGLSALLAPKRWTIIHIAAHGEWHPGVFSMSSSIVFPYGRRLSAQQLFQGCGRAQLVVMNCCWAARTGSEAGDLYGFPFALTSTGSLSAIFPKIPIHSEAAHRFADIFYTKLSQPQIPKLRAFSEAIRAMMGDQEWKHPAYWAPYTFIGHPGPIVWQEENPSYPNLPPLADAKLREETFHYNKFLWSG
jgi:CHAT domain-containing protein/ADP-ribose pyrophosphatase YjhB (NUDIX family)